MASSISSPPTRSDWLTTMPPSEITATSVVPPPMSTIMFPVGSATGRPAPIAAAIGSSIRYACRAPADGVDVSGGLIDRDDRRFAQHDAAPTHVHERVRRAEVDGHVAAAEAREVV